MTSIRIVGDPLSLKWAERNFNDSYCNVVCEKHGIFSEYWLYSEIIEKLLDPKEVKNVAPKLLDYVNSILHFEKEGFSPLSYDNIKIGNTIYAYFEEHLSICDDCVFIQDGKEVDLDSEKINKMKICYQNDENAKDVLRLYFKKGSDFVNLYRVYEKIKSFGIKPVAEGWITKTQESNFTNTANNPAASGYEARHGKSTGTPPSEPMTIAEAKQLLDSIINLYMEKTYKFLQQELS